MHNDESMITKICVMLEMQNEMNCRVDADWLDRQREWYRAIWIECAELMDHYGGWKWWKHSTPDIEQSVLEIVDIWHFGLSLLLQSRQESHVIATQVAGAWAEPPARIDFLGEVERLAVSALANRVFAIGSIHNLLAACERDFNDLYRMYVGKNVLNMFRQAHGYKDGSYIKQWQGQEDNEVLVELLQGLDHDAADFPAALDAALATRYAEVERLAAGG